ncbi:hypothetical protein CC1G_14961 [Coprinopsis cinerea okayama7|uniref:Uncharacterized protein n=1 Tax=Coprinopsis cinerea (strain Okayama-7 / 130 / ATCC MYA-4618 / FGSC 9003) TaxID=240176 RepID=D6RP93_COPC7|nr:hypothetical protein CC1G_14961 [Coprinopsis cinerea okayama7\|eukprot:XP_002910630.1 hypothetical protein CC1G_14961 [Coprinopsis cinerea okayama7\
MKNYGGGLGLYLRSVPRLGAMYPAHVQSRHGFGSCWVGIQGPPLVCALQKARRGEKDQEKAPVNPSIRESSESTHAFDPSKHCQHIEKHNMFFHYIFVVIRRIGVGSCRQIEEATKHPKSTLEAFFFDTESEFRMNH